MTEQEKDQSLKNKRDWMFVLYCISFWVIIVTMAIAFAKAAFLHGEEATLNALVHVDHNAIKNISMTVGLTGVLFTWLLQIIENKVLGQSMNKLFSHVFKQYYWQLGIFLVSLVMSIAYSSPESPSDLDKLVSVLSFVAMGCGLVNMWIMCIVFLFSPDMRINAAFEYLDYMVHQEKDDVKRLVLLQNWAEAVPDCIRDKDEIHVRGFVRNLMVDYEYGKMTPFWHGFRKHMFDDIMNKLKTDPYSRKSFLRVILSSFAPDSKTDGADSDNLLKGRYLSSLYAETLSGLYNTEKGDSIWNSTLERYLWFHTCEDMESCIHRDVVHIYLSQMIIQCTAGKIADMTDMLKLLDLNRDMLGKPAFFDRGKLQELISMSKERVPQVADGKEYFWEDVDKSIALVQEELASER